MNTSTTTTAIQARDFSDRVTDQLRDQWTAGKLRHLIAALNGRPVTLVTDNQTGHALFNVRLDSVIDGGGGWSDRVRITSTFSNGETQTLAHRTPSLGPVIYVIPDADGTLDRVKWDAKDTWREECSAAYSVATAKRNNRIPDAGSFGRWSARPTADAVEVSWNPDADQCRRNGVSQYGDDRHGFWYTTVSLAEVAAELDRRAQAHADYAAARERELAGVPAACEH